MLENSVIPIVNENDTISVTELMFTDNDELSGLIAAMMNVDALIILSNVDGIYDGLPSATASRLLAAIPFNSQAPDYIHPAKSQFGRGGMMTKFNIARKVANEGVPVIIANGKKDDILLKLLQLNCTETCTLFVPNPNPASNVKKWIAHSSGFARGEIHINAGARAALTSNKAASLLPVGLTAIVGEFEKGDIVKIIDENGIHIGLGKTRYSNEQATELIGLQGNKPVIHYDYLHLLS
jgi:glutamate 5-kinase